MWSDRDRERDWQQTAKYDVEQASINTLGRLTIGLFIFFAIMGIAIAFEELGVGLG